MKLVEILAREWFEWPINHDGPLAQNAHGGIYIPGSFRVDGFDAGMCMSVKQADDWRIALVTRAQWEAERARILADAQPERDEFIKELVDAACGNRSQYEQELWDKVAVSALAKSIGTYPDDSTSEQVRYCFEYADAFMAERAKRLKK